MPAKCTSPSSLLDGSEMLLRITLPKQISKCTQKHRVRMRQSTPCDTILIRLEPKWLRKYVYQSILCELKESVIVQKSVHGVLCVELRVVAERGSRKLLTGAHHQEEDPSLLITLFPRESTVCELVNDAMQNRDKPTCTKVIPLPIKNPTSDANRRAVDREVGGNI